MDVRDGTHDSPKYTQEGYPLITSKDFKNGQFDFSKTRYISEVDYKNIIKRSKVDIGDILYSMIGGNIGSMIYIQHDNYFDMAIKNVALFKPYQNSDISTKYIAYFLESKIKEYQAIAIGGAQPFVGLDIFRNTLVPLPPLAEQHRIITEIEKWLALIDQIEQGKVDLQTIIKQTKSKILDLAIHGKLVPQDPNDEPAIKLLKRINPDFTPCDNGHYTFDVPSGWITTNLGSIFNVVSAKRILKSDWKHSGVPFYRAREIAKLSIYGLVDNELYISEEHYNSLKEKFPVPKASDIMISAVGTIGKCYIVKESDKFYYKDASVLCLCNDYQINAKYIYHIMRSEYMLKQMYDNSKGTTVDTITIEKAKQYILPLPPLAEQQRIVAKIEETFSIFDGIQN